MLFLRKTQQISREMVKTLKLVHAFLTCIVTGNSPGISHCMHTMLMNVYSNSSSFSPENVPQSTCSLSNHQNYWQTDKFIHRSCRQKLSSYEKKKTSFRRPFSYWFLMGQLFGGVISLVRRQDEIRKTIEGDVLYHLKTKSIEIKIILEFKM